MIFLFNMVEGNFQNIKRSLNPQFAISSEEANDEDEVDNPIYGYDWSIGQDGRMGKRRYDRLVRSMYDRLLRSESSRLSRAMYDRLVRRRFDRLARGDFDRLARSKYDRLVSSAYGKLIQPEFENSLSDAFHSYIDDDSNVEQLAPAIHSKNEEALYPKLIRPSEEVHETQFSARPFSMAVKRNYGRLIKKPLYRMTKAGDLHRMMRSGDLHRMMRSSDLHRMMRNGDLHRMMRSADLHRMMRSGDGTAFDRLMKSNRI